MVEQVQDHSIHTANTHNAEREQIKQVISFLDVKESKAAALDIILSYSTTPQHRELFHGTDIIKILLRLLPDGQYVRIASCLINFSHDNYYKKDLIKLNVAGRVFDFLKENVKMDMKADEKTSAQFLENDNAYIIRDATDNEVPTAIEYLIMLLSNITVNEVGQKYLLGSGATQGAILDNLFGMFCFFTKHGSFDFVSNILANLSAIKEGRDYMLRNKMLAKIIEFLKFERVNQHRRAHLIETMRNIAFEYEIEEKFFSQIHLVQDCVQMLVAEQGIITLNGILKPMASSYTKTRDQVSIPNTKNLLDCLVLLANSEELLKEMEKLNIVEALDQIYNGGLDDIDVQVQVLKNQIAAVGIPKITTMDSDDEEEEKKEDSKAEVQLD
eukprot:403336931